MRGPVQRQLKTKALLMRGPEKQLKITGFAHEGAGKNN